MERPYFWRFCDTLRHPASKKHTASGNLLPAILLEEPWAGRKDIEKNCNFAI